MAEVSLHESHDNGLSELLTVRLASPIVLNLDMQVKRPVTAEGFDAVTIWAGELFGDFAGHPSIVLLPCSLL